MKLKENSKLETIGNVQLFFILKNVAKENDYNYFDRGKIENDDFMVDCDSSAKLTGIEDLTYVDYNYILACLIINDDFNFEASKPEGVLKRPEASLYFFDIDEDRTEHVRRTYRHKMVSYMPELVVPTFRGMDYNGDIDYYSGEEVDADYYDGETTSVDIDKSSVTKIQ